MESHLRPWAATPVIAAATVLGCVACGGGGTPSPTPTSSHSPSSSPSPTSLRLADAVLDTSDFSSGATTLSPSDVPDLTNIKCTPDLTSGLQQQYKSEVKASSGRIYGNVVVAYDSTSDAHSFITQFYSNAGSCSDASSQPVQDNFGVYSFYFSISGSPNNLRVEAVQVDKYITVLIQYLPSGTQPDQQSLRDLTQASVNKLQNVSS